MGITNLDIAELMKLKYYNQQRILQPSGLKGTPGNDVDQKLAKTIIEYLEGNRSGFPEYKVVKRIFDQSKGTNISFYNGVSIDKDFTIRVESLISDGDNFPKIRVDLIKPNSYKAYWFWDNNIGNTQKIKIEEPKNQIFDSNKIAKLQSYLSKCYNYCRQDSVEQQTSPRKK